MVKEIKLNTESKAIKFVNWDMTEVLMLLKDFFESWRVIRNKSEKGEYRIELRFKLLPRFHIYIIQSSEGVELRIHEDVRPHQGEFTERCENILKEIIFLIGSF